MTMLKMVEFLLFNYNMVDTLWRKFINQIGHLNRSMIPTHKVYRQGIYTHRYTFLKNKKLKTCLLTFYNAKDLQTKTDDQYHFIK